MKNLKCSKWTYISVYNEEWFRDVRTENTYICTISILKINNKFIITFNNPKIENLFFKLNSNKNFESLERCKRNLNIFIWRLDKLIWSI